MLGGLMGGIPPTVPGGRDPLSGWPVLVATGVNLVVLAVLVVLVVLGRL